MMKNLFLFFFLLIGSLPLAIHAQVESTAQANLRIRELMWNSGDEDFKITQPAEKWKNESAVFLCKKYEYSVKKELLINNIHENIYTHNRILLLDKSAVEKYSTFNFDISKNTGSFFGYSSSRKIYLGLKVIKPNGSENIVPIKEDQTDKITSRYSKYETQKVAVPNLEPGDILDYYVATEFSILGNFAYYGFSPVLYTMADEYPVQKQKIIMHIMRKCYLSSRSINGAPEFKILNKQNPRDITWIIEDTDRDKLRTQDFSYPLREVPFLIFQTFFAKNLFYNNVYFFIDKEDKLKNSISDFDWETYFKSIKNDSYYFYSQKIIKYWNKYCKKEKDPEILAKKAYFFLREYIFGNNYIGDIANKDFSKGQINEYIFTVALSDALSEKNIPHSIVITAPRELCDIRDIIIRQQMSYLIKVNTANPFYLSSFNLFTNSSIIDHSLQGNSAKSFQVSSEDNFNLLTKNIQIPIDNPSDNTEVQEINVSFNPDSIEKLEISQKITSRGNQKLYLQKEFISLSERVKEFEINPFNLKYTKAKQSAILAYKNNLNEDSVERNKRVLEYLKYIYGTDHITLKECRTIQTGIWDEKPEFIFQNSYTINDFISQAGNEIIINIGAFAGIQSTYDKSDSVRHSAIYVAFPRKLSLKISLALPNGYNVKGIENLNNKTINSTGSFISSAQLNGNNLEITIHKEYNNNFESKAKWPLFKQFIDAANDFRNHKIILTPGN